MAKRSWVGGYSPKNGRPKKHHNLPKKSYLYPEYTLEMTLQKSKTKCIIYNKVVLLDATTFVFIFTSLSRGFPGITFLDWELGQT